MDIDDGMRPRRAERLLIPATFITSLGNNIQILSAAMLLVRSEKTMLAVGWLFIAVAVPQAALSPLFGRLADRVDRRLLWFGCDLASAVAALALPVGMALGGPRDVFVYASNFALAVVNAAFVPASAALVKERVRPAELRGFNANYEIAMQAGMLLSASVGGLAVQWLGVTPLFVFNGGTFVVSALCVYAIGRGPARTVHDERSAVHVTAELPARAGSLMVLYAQGIIVVTIFNALFPVFLIGELHQSSGVFGAIDALGGLGFLFAAAAYRMISRRATDMRITVVGILVTGVVLVLQPQFGVVGIIPGILIGASLFGQVRIASRSLLLTSVPESQIGRAFGLANAYGLAGTIVAMLAVATVTDHSDSRYGYAFLALISVVTSGLALAANRLPRRRRLVPPLVPAETTSAPTA